MAQKNYTPRPDGFDHVKVIDNFNKAVDVGGVEVVAYLEAFSELARFFDMMGALFASMASDIRDQIKIMEAFLRSPNKENYKTIQSTLEYEKQNPALLEPKSKTPSGSRTILHLNRTLDFFVQFVSKVTTIPDEEKLPAVCNPAYKATLGKYHSWLLSKAAGLAISTLPTKVQLYERVSKYAYDPTVEYIAKLVTAMEITFKATDDFFTQNDLHGLPF